jgi:murein DD-endopeptidase MepM/ murein hydrolase activator NlpD
MKAAKVSVPVTKSCLILSSLLLVNWAAGCAKTPVVGAVLFDRLAPKPAIHVDPLAPVADESTAQPQAGDAALWPVVSQDMTVISEYGRRGRDQHRGIDIQAPMRSHVVATADGIVVFAGGQRGYGNVVKIEHGGGYQTVYGHLDSIVVRQGEAVRAGGVIGRLGATGNASTHHVHYEVVRKGKQMDPNPFLPALEQVASN